MSSSNASSGVVQVGKLLVHIAENGQSYELNCDEYTLVDAVQQFLESVSGIPIGDQLLLCLDVKLELHCPLSTYKLPSDDREVILFNKARMRSNAPPPLPEEVEIIDIPDPPLPSSSHDPHPLDDATDPALKALPSYERQFRFHFQRGHAIYSRSQMRIETCERLLREQKVQERALGIARGNLDHFYGMIVQNYNDFLKCYSQQYRSHSNLLSNFGRDIEKLRSCKLHPALQTANRKCLLDFVKEENLRKLAEDCSGSHRQFENKVTEFKHEFGELEHNAKHLFSTKGSHIIREVELAIRDHQKYVSEQKSIMQALSKDVNMVKKLVDDCLANQLSSSLRPHDAVSALGPMYECHEKSYLPKMQACDGEISNLVDFCKDKKNEMNILVHSYMQKVAYIQYTIKDIRCKFAVFQEALRRQGDLFEHLKVVRGIGPAYRACLAEVVRRKAAMKLYMGMAGQLAERLATRRETEVRRREEFLRVNSTYIPRDILASMGLYDTPNHCDVNITPFDTKLLDVDISDIDRYAPEYLLGLSSRSEKHGTLKSPLSMSNDGSQLAETELSDFAEKIDCEGLLQGLEVLDIAGTSKMEVENAKLRAELASKIAFMCSTCPDFDYESLDDSKIDSALKEAREKTSEALHLKEEYEKHLHSMLKTKQIQCESYEKRIQELEQRLSDHYSQGHTHSADEGVSNLTVSAVKNDDSKSDMPHMPAEVMDEVSCASSSSNIKPGSKQIKEQEGLDDNMTDSSGMISPQLDSSMLDPHREEEHENLPVKDKKDTGLAAGGDITLATSSMAVSISHPQNDIPSEVTGEQDLDAKERSDLLLELQGVVAEKSKLLDESEAKVKSLTEEVAKLVRELEIRGKLLDESQMNCAHLENCLHEAREEAQTHLCAADRRASEYSALRASAVKMRSLFERLRACVLSGGVAGLPESLRALSQSLANSINEKEEDGSAEFRECIRALADKVGALSRHRADLADKCTKFDAANKQLAKELDEKKELVNTLYKKHQHEKQANKEKISFGRLEVHEIAAFVLNSTGNYEAINRNSPRYYLSAESVALFTDHLPNRPSYIVGLVVHIERQTVRLPPSTSVRADHDRDRLDILTSDTGTTNRLSLNSGSTTNPYGLPVGCEYFVVTVAMLPDTAIHSSPTS
ncbi:PREDICTED: autophagy-related protein 11 [Nicotiana attenuata]|uniref:Autophagy-related protein 11 n=1 Tax=Nicotiana attenuata TaxID=49451 RepID=A0A1J6KC48_NICAT|nr:PREDICTED: autophagy-related protein 11 [Nicotiana attenuata]OIT26268.1 autophagy-related protein 11 [Nicotiana attenuata]